LEAYTTSGTMARGGEAELIARLRSGDDAAFTFMIEQHHAGVVRLCQHYVRDRALAEEAAQEAWLGVLRGLAGFEGRSSLRTWIYGIAVNAARTRARGEQRTVPFSSLSGADLEPFEPAVDPSRFHGPEHRYYGGWASVPANWADVPEERLLSKEVRREIQIAIDCLPDNQREVVVLRDIDGLSAQEVCNILGLSESNQRVLLHRGRSKVRASLERYLAGE
jgi:RNA polymerase sigma-70 factor (ECF subfamily)